MPEADRDVRTMCAASPPSSGGFAERVSRIDGIRARLPQPFASSSRRSMERRSGTSCCAELPPEVELELDVYWAAVGGRDPVAEIHADRRIASGCST